MICHLLICFIYSVMLRFTSARSTGNGQTVDHTQMLTLWVVLTRKMSSLSQGTVTTQVIANCSARFQVIEEGLGRWMQCPANSHEKKTKAPKGVQFLPTKFLKFCRFFNAISTLFYLWNAHFLGPFKGRCVRPVEHTGLRSGGMQMTVRRCVMLVESGESIHYLSNHPYSSCFTTQYISGCVDIIFANL